MTYNVSENQPELIILQPQSKTYALPIKRGLWNPSLLCLNPKYCDHLEPRQQLIHDENIVGMAMFRHLNDDQCHLSNVNVDGSHIN